MGKTLVYAGVTIGGVIGAYLPVVLFDASALGLASLAGSFVGGIVGLWAGYRLYRYLDL
ncbi:MAG TPA: hypothetical protein VK576_04685 [Thermoleophilia bacterium]|nr:hypothetical protein [Thermoleophilia bacterium]